MVRMGHHVVEERPVSAQMFSRIPVRASVKRFAASHRGKQHLAVRQYFGSVSNLSGRTALSGDPELATAFHHIAEQIVRLNVMVAA